MVDLFKNAQYTTLVDVLNVRSQNQRQKIAFTFLEDGEAEQSVLTYQDLDLQARAIAAYLQSLVPTGSRILLLYPSGLEFVSAFFGCLYAGVIAVPAYPPKRNQKMSRLVAIATNAQASLILTTKKLLVNIQNQFSENSELAKLPLIATDSIALDQAHSWQEPSLNENTLAFLQYTSGSTGTPKGVMVSHGNLLHNEQMIQQAFGHFAEEVIVGWLPLFHDMGLVGNLLQPLYLGMPSILMSPEAFLMKPVRWLETITRYKATTSGGPNFAYDLCVRKVTPEQRANLDLSSWQLAFNGSEPVRAETLEQFAHTFADCGFRKQAFYPCYGMAETTLLVSGGLKTAFPVVRKVQETALRRNQVIDSVSDEKESTKIVGCGKVSLDQKVIIVDPESLTQCTPEQIGEIWFSSPSVAQGYWNQPEQTQQTFQAFTADTKEGPFLRTGDLGFLQGSELFVTGRLKDLIIIRGTNHYPQDIELTVEQSHPVLRSSCGAAFAVEVDGVERLVIAQEVERTSLRQLNVDEVVGAIRKAVSEQHDLQVYAVLLLKPASIPKTSSGKIQRHACRAGFLNNNLNVIEQWMAKPQEIDLIQLQTDIEYIWKKVQNSVQETETKVENNTSTNQSSIITEEKIQAWLISHLSLELKIPANEIDIQESFAYYGMDSAIAVNTVGQLMDWLEFELEPTLFWEYSNIESLTKHLVERCNLLPASTQVCS
ncbi:AMP-binding protein [Nostoc sp. MS1]|uniref:AMP-binding protein n=1 Tax=Nostoc sp. MS1 TaxID=2764711 RepID=UPI001CC775E5|nr:AMP-binding protein [Nostoc sp. MS1]BCL39998.1 acyl-CoA synthetase [Nostoc sp. MS1]